MVDEPLLAPRWRPHVPRLTLDGELLDGSHRVACALALGLPEVPVKREARYVWAPPWGERWFIDHGMGEEDLERVRRDVRALADVVPGVADGLKNYTC